MHFPPRTRFILIETSHAGNVGAAARAMRTMGFEDLVLVRPRDAKVLTRLETVQRASGAVGVLNNARIVATLDEALDGMTHLCATAMIGRDFGPPTRSPRAHFEQFGTPSSPYTLPAGIAFLFGAERFGMANEDVYKCHVALQIPTDPQFGSLNLAAAVQLIAYEWRQCLLALGDDFAPAGSMQAATPTFDAQVSHLKPADAAQIQGALAHWQQALEHLAFLDPAAPKKLMPRLNDLANRAALREHEVHILRGIAKAVLKQSPASKAR